MAHKKAGGSSRNGRDSAGRRLGVKKFGDQAGRRRQHHHSSARHQMACRRECRHGQRPYPLCHGRWPSPIPDASRPSLCIGRTGPRGRRVNGESETKELPPASHRPGGSELQTGPQKAKLQIRIDRGGGMSTSPSSFQGPGRARPDRSKTMFPDLTRDDVFRLETRRLWLRWPRLADVQAIVRLAGEKAVAEMTARIPHPYHPDDAERFVFQARRSNADGQGLQLAITPKGRPNSLIGMVGIGAESRDGQAHLGYWLGTPYWGKGYATEAARALIDAFFAYGEADELTACGPGHQPGLPAGAGEVRLRLSGRRPRRVAGPRRPLSGRPFPPRPAGLGEPEDLGPYRPRARAGRPSRSRSTARCLSPAENGKRSRRLFGSASFVHRVAPARPWSTGAFLNRKAGSAFAKNAPVP